ncbi:L-asparaginase 1 isoform X2 [Lepeophtheirus salmonis]|uniref:L-asparaginase 1 isoform X2 n=1 Tax=Lepeophtheirus salmonis TaxID=72036 RepID=UPI001AE6505B|nr:L-asparaginase-like isoform X2 [Lepeophtheirus salmonis]XP_040577048.1 L-asparaginase-like isoform X2 [Lepeophtheirus salmonis]
MSVFEYPSENCSDANNSEIVDDCSVRKQLRHSSTLGIHNLSTLDIHDESRVLVLYTGGTIGMVRNEHGSLVPKPQTLETEVRKIKTMHDSTYWDNHPYTKPPNDSSTQCPLVLPNIDKKNRVVYTIYEYDPILDSSNMTMDDWIRIAQDIHCSYELFDGFVILHGTDTLSYTASALSFMLENLGKTVIITGSQIPCFEVQSDGRDNFVGSLILAGNYTIPEVSVYFSHKLMRGNRTIKISVGKLNAFDTPNMAPLVEVGIDIQVDYKAIFKPTAIQKFNAHAKLNRNVVTLRIFPSITIDIIEHFLLPPIQGVVLQCYGAGNLPTNRVDIVRKFKEANDKGIIIIVCTQCLNGAVSGIYETGKTLLDAGVIPSSDITPEAALTKLCYVLSKNDLSLEEKKDMMRQNIRGEMTVIPSENGDSYKMGQDDDFNIMESIIRTMHLSSSVEINRIQEILFPPLITAIVMKGDPSKFDELRKYGLYPEIRLDDYDQRTPLHIAANAGNLKMVEYLLQQGSNVHLRDRNNDTPLLCAVKGAHMNVIHILREAGAHIHLTPIEVGERLSRACKRGDSLILKAYLAAGANANTKNLNNQTPLHSAVETNQREIVELLLKNGAELDKLDLYGRTPREIAVALKRKDIMDTMDIWEDSLGL